MARRQRYVSEFIVCSRVIVHHLLNLHSARVHFFFGRIILNRLAGGSVTKKLDELETNWNSRTCFLRCASGDKSIRRGKLASSYPLSNYVIWVGNAAVSINNLNTLKEAQRLFQFLPVPPRYHGCKPTVNKSNHFYSIRRTGETNLVYKFYKSSRTKKRNRCGRHSTSTALKKIIFPKLQHLP